MEARTNALFGQLAMAEGRDEEAVATLQVKAAHDCLMLTLKETRLSYFCPKRNTTVLYLSVESRVAIVRLQV